MQADAHEFDLAPGRAAMDHAAVEFDDDRPMAVAFVVRQGN